MTPQWFETNRINKPIDFFVSNCQLCFAVHLTSSYVASSVAMNMFGLGHDWGANFLQFVEMGLQLVACLFDRRQILVEL